MCHFLLTNTRIISKKNMGTLLCLQQAANKFGSNDHWTVRILKHTISFATLEFSYDVKFTPVVECLSWVLWVKCHWPIKACTEVSIGILKPWLILVTFLEWQKNSNVGHKIPSIKIIIDKIVLNGTHNILKLSGIQEEFS